MTLLQVHDIKGMNRQWKKDMIKPKTFIDESIEDQKIYYDVHENGFVYRPDNDEKFSFNWEDIQYLEDFPGYKVDILLNGQKEVPVRYTTQDFSDLLKTICFKLSEIRKDSFQSQKFKLSRKYFYHLSFVISIPVLVLIICIIVGFAFLYLLLILFIPVCIFIYRQPISITIRNRGLLLRNLFVERAITYSEIEEVDFIVKSNDYENVLCVLIHLKNKETMTIKKFQNMILFFILLPQ